MIAQAQISIYPKQDTYQVDTVIPVETTPIIAPTQISQTESLNLEATSEQQVENTASGKIKISNLYSKETQDLIKNTRFETPQGLVYRIKNQTLNLQYSGKQSLCGLLLL
jgi:hypothetical protein